MPKNNSRSNENKQPSTSNKSPLNQQNNNSYSLNSDKKNDNPKPNKVDMHGIQTKGIKK